MWIGVLWAGLRVATWITHVGGKYRHGLLEKSLNALLVRVQCTPRGSCGGHQAPHGKGAAPGGMARMEFLVDIRRGRKESAIGYFAWSHYNASTYFSN